MKSVGLLVLLALGVANPSLAASVPEELPLASLGACKVSFKLTLQLSGLATKDGRSVVIPFREGEGIPDVEKTVKEYTLLSDVSVKEISNNLRNVKLELYNGLKYVGFATVNTYVYCAHVPFENKENLENKVYCHTATVKGDCTVSNVPKRGLIVDNRNTK
jgi:hypothetical protein